MGTELAARGVATPLPTWSAGALDGAPEAVVAIHRDYAAAGAEVHTSNTFRTRRSDVGERWRELTLRAVALAREGAGEGRVAGSIAPVADCYRPDLSPGEGAYDAHAAMAAVLLEGGADLILCETFPEVHEAVAAVRAARDAGATEVWGSLTAGPEADLLSPAELATGAERLAAAGASVLLANCIPALRMADYLAELGSVGVPFGAYANAGSADDRIGWRSDGSFGPERYAELAERWAEQGATVLGGCCGTGPAHLRALVTRLRG
jgi:S-methylmethionine-dependent homocysteine/selenocysteine methylase